jgi:hypothetical protein
MSERVAVPQIPTCDLCDKATPAYADARLPGLGWANVCKPHFDRYGCSLGTGSGQELITR